MNFQKWKKLILSSESADRADAADQLPDDGDKDETIELLLKALDDRDPLVRACAVTSLRYFREESVSDRLMVYIESERDSLAIAYGMSSLGEIGGKRELNFLLKSREKYSQDQLVLLHLKLAILSCVVNDFSCYIESKLSSDSPDLRGATINTAGEAMSKISSLDSGLREMLASRIAKETCKGNLYRIRDALIQ